MLQDLSNIDKYHKEVLDEFWNSPVDYEDTHINKNFSPFLVMLETPMSKIHFLFTMLNINLLIVMKKGVIKGIITKLEFIQKRKTLNPKEEEEAK